MLPMHIKIYTHKVSQSRLLISELKNDTNAQAIEESRDTGVALPREEKGSWLSSAKWSSLTTYIPITYGPSRLYLGILCTHI